MANRGAMATVASIPSGDTIGGVPRVMYHVKCTCKTTGSGTYLIPHNMPYTPTFCYVILQEAESSTAPAATGAIVSWCPAQTDGTSLAVTIPATTTMTFDVYFG